MSCDVTSGSSLLSGLGIFGFLSLYQPQQSRVPTITITLTTVIDHRDPAQRAPQSLPSASCASVSLSRPKNNDRSRRFRPPLWYSNQRNISRLELIFVGTGQHSTGLGRAGQDPEPGTMAHRHEHDTITTAGHSHGASPSPVPGRLCYEQRQVHRYGANIVNKI